MMVPHSRFGSWLATASLLLAVPSVARAQESSLPALRTQAASHAPGDVLALGRALRRAGHFDEAARTLQSTAHGPSRNEVLYEIARVRFDEGNFHAAERACNQLPAGHGDHDPGGLLRHLCMGRAYLVWHRVALAEREITAAQAIAPTDGELQLVIAESHRMAGEVGPAETSYRAAQSTLASRPEPWVGEGALYEVAQRFDDAEAAYRHAVQADEHDPASNLALGRFLFRRRNRPTDALPFLTRATTERPHWAEALVALGNAQLATHAVNEALVAFAEAAQLSAVEPGAQSGLGRGRVINHQYAEAEPPLRLAIAQVPNDGEAHVALAELLGATNRGDESIEEWDRAIGLIQDASVRMGAAVQAHAMGQNSLARSYLSRILADDAQSAPALTMMADIAYEENDRVNARQMYQSALAGHGEFDRAHVQARITDLDAPVHIRRR